MVMTLRKRSAPSQKTIPSSYSSSSDSESETHNPTTKKSRPTKPKPKLSGKENAEPYIVTSSDSDSGSESDSEGENGYEKFREQRMRENKERMEKLGIFALCSQFNGVKKGLVKKVSVKKTRNPPLYPRQRSYDYRRSDRLKDLQQGKYLETESSLKGMGITIPDEWKSEFYTEEDEKLLGNCETEWTLNVDGFGEDGERLYDPVNGTSCHQCRQKTIRKHTYCGKCRLPQGQICGDCLYTRYGENVLETTQNPAWTCPACRGICNCSRCRRAKGWPPVNILYQKVNESGYKSVAHYLILTRCAGAMTKESKEGTPVVDLTAVDTQAPVRYEGSDTSADWAESDDDDSDSDDDDSKTSTKNVAQTVENHDGGAELPSDDAVEKHAGGAALSSEAVVVVADD